MIDRPRYRLTLRPQGDAERRTTHSRPDVVVGSSASDRVLTILGRLREQTNFAGGALPPVVVEVAEEISPHVGFGSGTQLALALARAAGYSRTHRFDNLESFAIESERILAASGPAFTWLRSCRKWRIGRSSSARDRRRARATR